MYGRQFHTAKFDRIIFDKHILDRDKIDTGEFHKAFFIFDGDELDREKCDKGILDQDIDESNLRRGGTKASACFVTRG